MKRPIATKGPTGTALFGVFLAGCHLGGDERPYDPDGDEAPQEPVASAQDELGTTGTGADEEAIGLSLWWRDGEVRANDGSVKTVTLYEDYERFIHEIDVTASVATDTDEGIEPVTEHGDLAGLDWTGVEHVETDWRPDLETGGYIRQRFYRGANWMENHSLFMVMPVTTLFGHEIPAGAPIVAQAGSDDEMLSSDDGFIRRFVARQLTFGCADIDDCSDATGYEAQGLVQFRNALDPEGQATPIPDHVDRLKLLWTEDPQNPREVAIEHASYEETDWEYGFEVDPEILDEPANGEYYVPGESFDVRVTFRDGAGNRLHPEGSLPRYIDFANDDIESGLRLYDGIEHLLTLYYALKHREGLVLWGLAGPTDKLKQSSTVVTFDDWFLPQTEFATVEEDGYTALSIANPNAAQIFVDPTLPVSDTRTFTIPEDALPGTYVLSMKARRDWGGQALNRGAVEEIQVGTSVPTEFDPATGNCESCHNGQSDLGNLLHGLGDRRTCYSCHSEMSFEPDQSLDYRIHLIHSRSDRMPADPTNCTLCHDSEPEGAPRGFPGVEIGD